MQKLRRLVLFVLGRKCRRCGFSDERALQIDHIAGNGCKERALGSYRLYRRVLAHKKDYQLLCANCNWIKRFENNEHRNGRRPLRSARDENGVFHKVMPQEAEEKRAREGKY